MEDFVAYPSRRRLALLALGAVTFVAAGLWMGGAFGSPPDSRRYSEPAMFAIGWFGVVLFGACGLVAGKKLFETGEQLRIGSAGVRWAPWSDQTLPWPEIIDVTTWSSRGQKVIVLHLRDPDRFPGRGLAARLAGANRMLTGGDISISLTGTDRGFDEAMSAIVRFRLRDRCVTRPGEETDTAPDPARNVREPTTAVSTRLEISITSPK